MKMEVMGGTFTEGTVVGFEPCCHPGLVPGSRASNAEYTAPGPRDKPGVTGNGNRTAAHSAALRGRLCSRTSVARRAMSSSLCSAVKVKRQRAVPAGTEIGRAHV